MSKIRSFRREKQRNDERLKKKAQEQVYEEYFNIDTMFPFDQTATFFMCWMTPVEWKFIFALSLALEEAEVIEQETPMEVTFINTIAYLARECGYQLKHLHYTENDELYATQSEAPGKGNMASIQALRVIREREEALMRGQPEEVEEEEWLLMWRLAMSYIQHTELAIEYAQEYVPSLDIDYLRHALNLHHSNLSLVRQNIEAIPEWIKRALLRESAARRQFFEAFPDIAAQMEVPS